MKTQFLKKSSSLGVIVYISLIHSVLAYEVHTHEDMSEKAALSSSLNKYLPTIELKSLDEELGDISVKQSIINWIRKGAHDEDDTFSLNFARYRNHFYNPLTELGLNAAATGEPSPDWGLEDTQTFAMQSYSFRDVRQYFYDALTLPNKDNRDQRMARTFNTLGHVIHLIQDAAQPQHTRNDSHGGGIFGPPSLYEKWTDRDTVRPNLPYTSHPPVMFNVARAFWTNDSGMGLAQFTNRNFVSAGTNFQMLDGRVSANSTFRNPEPASETSVDVQQLFANEKLPPPRDQNGDLLYGDIVFIGSNVDGVLNPRASTLSIFDQDLKTYNKTVTYDADPFDPNFHIQVTVDRAFTLNQFNFRAAYPYLIPKAVGYSAGLIDYFFRGKIELDVEYDTSTEGQYLIRNDSEEEMKGDFTLYYDGVDGKRYPLKGDSNAITWRDVTIGPNKASAPLKAPKIPSDPKSKTGEYFLVFKGEMGEERPADAQSVGAVVAKNKQKLFWEPWREGITDNRPWVAGAGTVNNQVGPNSQQVQNGQLVEYVGAGGAGFVVWKAANAEDMLPTQFMKLGITCSENALATNWNVYAYLFIAPTINGQIDWGHSQAIPFAGGAGPSSGFDLMNKKIPVTPTEYVVDLRLLNRLGLKQIGYMSIETIGFDMDLTCSVDYLDFSEEPFEKVSEGAVYFP